MLLKHLKKIKIGRNKEIKKLWEIFGIGGLIVVLLTLFSGVKILFFPTIKINFINDYGGFIFFIFILIFTVLFFDNKKSKEITGNEQQKYSKS